MSNNHKTILVCGGAGYIGSHMSRMLAEHGYRTVVLDDLSTGHLPAVERAAPGLEFIRGTLLDRPFLEKLMAQREYWAVMHFAGKIQVGESVAKPDIYYENNVIGALNLLLAMRKSQVNRLVFSSTAAVYGLPQTPRLAEDHPLHPVNPYGRTKLQFEEMLRDFSAAYPLNCVALRYFNAAGAHPAGDLGEAHDPETHLIPNVLRAVLGRIPALSLFGDDYETPDGTCVRDYIHVQDLCSAHLLALEHLDKQPGFRAFNLGNGNGFSIRQVIAAAEAVTGRKVPYAIAPRRAGDPPYLVADSAKARQTLNWRPQYPDLETIVENAWRWHQAPGY